MNAMDLMATIGLDSSKFDSGLNKAESNFTSFGSKLGSGLKTAGKVAVGAIAAVSTAVVGLGTAFVKSASKTAQYADNIDKMSQKLGMSAKGYQEWDFILQHAGTSIDSMQGAMKKLATAAETDADAFAKLGLSQDKISKMSQEQLFGETIKALQNVKDGTERTYLATQLLGRGATELGPLLNMSAEEVENLKNQVHELGGVMEDDAVKAGARFQDSLQNMKTALSGLKNNLMANFLPSLSTVMDGLAKLFSGDDSGIALMEQGFSDLSKKINEELPKFVKIVSNVLQNIIKSLPEFFNTIGEMLPTLIDQLLPPVLDALVGLVTAVANAMPKIINVITNNIEKITDAFFKIVVAVIDVLPDLIPELVKLAVGIIKALADGFSKNAEKIIGGIMDVVIAIIDALTDPNTLNTLIDATITILEALMDAITNNFDKIERLIEVLVENTVDILIECTPILLEGLLRLLWALVKGLGEALVKALSRLLTFLGEAGAEILTQIGHFGAEVLTAVGKGLQGILQSIGHFLGTALYDMTTNMKKVWASMGETLSEFWGTFRKLIQNFWTKVKNTFTDLFSGIYDIGKNLMIGLWNGIKDFGGHVVNGVKNLGRSIVGGFKSVFGIASPSKVTRQYGRFLVEGLGLGIEDEESSVLNGVYKFGKGITKALEKSLEIHSPSRTWFKDGALSAQGYVNGVVSSLKKQAKIIGNEMQTLTEEQIEEQQMTSGSASPTEDIRKMYEDAAYAEAHKNDTNLTLLGKANAMLQKVKTASDMAKAADTLMARKGSIWGRSFAGEDVHLGAVPTGGYISTVSPTGSHGGGSGLGDFGGGGGSGGYGGGGSSIDSAKLDDILSVLRLILEKDPTFTSDLILDNTKIGAVITSINADNTIRSGGYANG